MTRRLASVVKEARAGAFGEVIRRKPMCEIASAVLAEIAAGWRQCEGLSRLGARPGNRITASSTKVVRVCISGLEALSVPMVAMRAFRSSAVSFSTSASRGRSASDDPYPTA